MTQLLPHATGPADEATPIECVEQLVDRLKAGAKTGVLRIGLEHEKLGYHLETGQRLPYEGPAGIRALLTALADRFGHRVVEEDGNPIALVRGATTVSLEPGGQLELSGAPHLTLAETARELDQHLREVQHVAEPLGVVFLGVGFCPVGAREDVPWMPRSRYRLMRESMARTGTRGLDMMLRTATVQANLDFSSEEDMGQKLQVALGVSALVTAVTASSALVERCHTGWQSHRMRTWMETDPARCGLLRFAVEKPARFMDYVQWALDVPLLFIRRGWIHHAAPPGLTMRRWMKDGAGLPPLRMSDFDDLLGTLFPDVRLRTYLEMRTADAGPRPHLLAVAGLWKGLLYSAAARKRAWSLVAGLTWDDRQHLRLVSARDGLHGRVGHLHVGEAAAELCLVARDGLRELGEPGEPSVVEPLLQRARARRSLADELAEGQGPYGLDPRTRLC